MRDKIQYKDQVFNSAQDYFQYMVDTLGFPEVLNHFDTDSIHSDGLQLNLDILNYNKNAPTIVFVPGTSVYGLCYAELLYQVHIAGYNIVSLDPRGHGRSEGKRGDYTIQELMKDVENTVQYAKQMFNSKVSLMGSSQGGIVSFYLAAKDLQVDSIICQNVADLGSKDTNKIVRYPRLASAARPLLNIAGSMFPKLTISTLSYLNLKEIKVKYFQNLHQFIVDDPFTNEKISLRAAKSLAFTSLDKPIEEITIPTFVFQGTNDSIFPVSYTQELYDKLTCNKQLKLYEGCDHAIMVENSDLVKKDIIDWLANIYS